jgi:hypothetical protein
MSWVVFSRPYGTQLESLLLTPYLRVTKQELEEAGRMHKKRLERRTPTGSTASRENATSLEHLAVKDLVLFLTGRTSRPDTTGHEQGRPDGDENCRTVRLKLEKPTCEGV